jgi:hypothetical protein
MSTLKLTLSGLTLLVIATTASVPAFAGPPKIKPDTVAPSEKNTPVQTNGTVKVGTQCTGEFTDHDRSMTFFERPASICVLWDDRRPVAQARWELWKDIPGTSSDQKIASGSLPASSLGSGTRSTFDISLGALPQYNEGSSDQRYFVKMFSRLTFESEEMGSAQGTLIHRPKSAEPKPQPEDPYQCKKAADDYERTVMLRVPAMTVNQTTSTKGDGDRDEVYIEIDRLGPDEDQDARRLPGNDDYYEAKQNQTSTDKWTNKDGKNRGAPILWTGQLEHEDIVTLGVTIMEQDNADLASVRKSIMDALIEVEKAALSTKTEWGAIVAAVAAALTVGTSLIPETNGHDFIGFVAVRMENKCGHIRTVWTTFHEWDVPNIGKLKNDFINSGTQEAFESRLVVHSWPATEVAPDAGYDWGPFNPAGLNDSFWWVANGSSGSKYTFTLASRLLTKAEADVAKAAAKKAEGMIGK